MMSVSYTRIELILKINDTVFGSTVKLEFINCEVNFQADFMIITTVQNLVRKKIMIPIHIIIKFLNYLKYHHIKQQK